MKSKISIFRILLTVFTLLVIILAVIIWYILHKNPHLYSKEALIIYKARFFTWKQDCPNLKESDIKILNKEFKKFSYIWDLKYWCNLQSLRIYPKANTDTKYKLHIPEELSKLKNLYELSIRDVLLDWDIPEKIWDMKNLVSLTLYWFKKIPLGVERLENLKIFYFDRELFSTLPKVIQEKILKKEIISYPEYLFKKS